MKLPDFVSIYLPPLLVFISGIPLVNSRHIWLRVYVLVACLIVGFFSGKTHECCVRINKLKAEIEQLKKMKEQEAWR